MLLPAATGSGEAALLTLRSEIETTVAISVAVSLVRLISPPPLTRAVFVRLAGAVWPTLRFTVIAG